MLGKVDITSSDGYDLETAAEEFQKVHGDEATVVALHSNFRTKLYTDDQATIVTQPWKRIYTTNYDDVIETICSDNRKPITIPGVNDPVSQPMPGTTQLLHIYGNIGRASAHEFATTFLLTERQRDNSPFLKSPWMRAFHDDVLAASSLIFVGFSLTDIDIRRLLGLMPPDVLQKIHFVNRLGTKQPILTRMKSDLAVTVIRGGLDRVDEMLDHLQSAEGRLNAFSELARAAQARLLIAMGVAAQG